MKSMRNLQRKGSSFYDCSHSKKTDEPVFFVVIMRNAGNPYLLIIDRY